MQRRKATTTSRRAPSPRTEGSDGTNARSESEALRLLGLARRAGSVVAGSEAVKGAARAGALRAVVFATDASENARRRIDPLIERQGVRAARCGDRAALGAAVGKGPIAVLGITDAALAQAVLGRLDASRR